MTLYVFVCVMFYSVSFIGSGNGSPSVTNVVVVVVVVVVLAVIRFSIL